MCAGPAGSRLCARMCTSVPTEPASARAVGTSLELWACTYISWAGRAQRLPVQVTLEPAGSHSYPCIGGFLCLPDLPQHMCAGRSTLMSVLDQSAHLRMCGCSHGGRSPSVHATAVEYAHWVMQVCVCNGCPPTRRESSQSIQIHVYSCIFYQARCT